MKDNLKNKNEARNIVQNCKRDDNAYGGSKYRLTYDKYENPRSAERKQDTAKPVAYILFIVLLVVFLLLGFLIIKYYTGTIEKLKSSDKSGEKNVSFNFQFYSESGKNDDNAA